MTFSVNVIALFVVFGTLAKAAAAQGAQVQGVDNAEQFALLCRIYNVAKNPPIDHTDIRDPNKIVNEIDALNGSISGKKQFNETEESGNSLDPAVKPTTTRETAVAQAILSRITQKAHTILKEIKKTNISEEIEKAKAEFNKVIFGEGGSESDLDQGALNGITGRSAACGDSGLIRKGASAGKNLVVDFFCLCAQRTSTSEGIDNVCGVQVGGKSKGDYHGWGDASPSGSVSMWASIKKGCGNLLHQPHKFIEESHEVIEDFLRHLKTGGVYRWGAGKDSDRKPGMLGTGVGTNGGTETGPACDGKKSNGRGGQPPAGICVYYGHGNWDDNIPWLKILKTALDSLATVNNQTATIQRDIERLQTLLHRAEEIYETTKVISEIQQPAAPKDFQTAAKRLIAYNAAWIHPTNTHFILLFVLP